MVVLSQFTALGVVLVAYVDADDGHSQSTVSRLSTVMITVLQERVLVPAVLGVHGPFVDVFVRGSLVVVWGFAVVSGLPGSSR